MFKLFFILPALHIHCKNLFDVACDIQIQKTTLHESINEFMASDLPPTPAESNNTVGPALVQVTLPRNQGLVYAKIDREDAAKVVNVSEEWYINPAGYIFTIHRNRGDKLRYIYLHKVIAGGTAKHINGDRLDNRKANLMLTRQNVEQT